MQQRTLNHLTRLIESLGFETTKTFAYANYGKVNIHKVDEVCPIGSVSFDFQPGTMKFSITINGEKILSQPPRTGYYDFYMEHTAAKEYKAFCTALERKLKLLNKL